MTIPRTLLGIPLALAAALMLAAQLLLVAMPAADTALERIRLAPELWSAAHVLIAAALVLFVIGAATLVKLQAAAPLAVLAFAVLTTGAIIAAMTNGVDAVLGVLSGIGADGQVHRAIAENLVQPLDLWDAALTIGLVALVALLHARSTVPWWGTAAALVGLAVPAFSDLRVIAAAAVLAGFVVLAASIHRPATVAPTWATIVIIAAYLPAAFFSVERAALLLIVAVIVLLARRQTKDRKVAAL